MVILLFLVQTCSAGCWPTTPSIRAQFYVPLIAKMIPYSWAKSWHLQLAIFWIATPGSARPIYLAPIIGGREPRGQGLLVNLLFAAPSSVAVGSLVGEVLGIKGWLGEAWFWLGHQGWEYLELGGSGRSCCSPG